MQRRDFLKQASLAGMALSLMPHALWAAENIGKITKTDEEWKKMLTKEQYDVLRCEGTESPFTSPLLKEHRAGKFVCAACDLELFNSEAKFDSGTGWPSFFQAIPEHVETKSDHKLLMERTEYHCARCGGHQGHVFNDGPHPTGLRYCNNGVALKFVAKEG
ncbi:MAG: peptide-methionine (R)-S-oxide reductase MsrB [Alphaproteobacteria bacterium]|nr:peptide-methionine (R)-S-oxide reductase MsrB [Alphaproteobacteria bacterium]